MNDSTKVTTCVAIAIVGLLLTLCVALLFGAFVLFGASVFSGSSDPLALGPSDAPTPDLVMPTPDLSLVSVSDETLRLLESAIVPENDPRDLGQRLLGLGDIPLTVPSAPANIPLGTVETFWATNTDSAVSFEVTTRLAYETPHLYFWIQEGIDYDPDDLAALATAFEQDIYPQVRAFFGSEWTPGIDGDPHLYVVFAEGLGSSIAGYFSSADEVHPLAHEYSNAHEMFFISADNVELNEGFTYGVLAHEFQHMIHWNGDRNESTWMNEGFSEVASFLLGYDPGGFDYSYTSNPDIQLNTWPVDGSTTPHYGGAFLFLTYFLDRMGETATQALVASQQNGLVSIDDVLVDFNQPDFLRGRIPTADDLFQDWTLASFLQDGRIADGRYTYNNYPGAPSPEATETVRSCPTETGTRLVHQYGVDYIRITCQGRFTLRFEGAAQIPLLPTSAYSGDYAFWSNRGDESDMTLTRQFDLSQLTGPVTFSFWTWYDIEVDYDYVYLEASTDGERWQILQTPSGTASDPSGNSYGWGYNGLSGSDGSWVQQTVDLSEFAGGTLWLRFEYITDAAVNGEGLMIDDIAIPELDYFADFENDDEGWEAAGFVRVQNVLPQFFRLAWIEVGPQTSVNYLPVSDGNVVEFDFEVGGGTNEIVLVVSGTTRFTRQQALYSFEILPTDG
jgi:hypothetical protein